MKSYLNRIASLAAIGALAIGTTPAFADSENAATVINDAGCTGFVPTEAGGIPSGGPFFNTAHNTHKVASKGGGQYTMCSFDVPDHLVPTSVRKAEGFLCYAAKDVLTRDSMMQVTPGGRGFLICRSR